MKIPKNLARQSKGFFIKQTLYGSAAGEGRKQTEVVGTTAQLKRFWEHNLRCIARFNWGSPQEHLGVTTMYNVEMEGVLEDPRVQEILARLH